MGAAQSLSKSWQSFLLLAACALPCSVHADPAATRALAGACYGCHVETQTNLNIPAIQGQTVAQLTNSLNAFRSGQRSNTLMTRIARGYSPAELAQLAQHFGQPVKNNQAK